MPIKSPFLFIAFCILSTSFCIAQQKNFKQDSIQFNEMYSEVLKVYNLEPERAKNLIDSSLQIFNRILPVTDSTQFFQRRKIRILARRAWLQIKDGTPEKALTTYYEIIALKESIGERKLTVNEYLSISDVWGEQGEVDKAKVAMDSAYSIIKQTGHEAYLCPTYRRYAAYYNALHVADSAAYYFEKGIACAEDQGDLHEKMSLYRFYGLNLINNHKFKEAKKYVEESSEYSFQNTNKASQVEAYYALGHLYYGLHEYRKSITNFDKGIALAEELDFEDYLIYLYDEATRSITALENYKKAYEYQEKARALEKKKFDERVYRSLADQSAEFKYKKKQTMDSIALVQAKRMEILQKEKQASTRFWITVAIFSLLLFLATFIYFYNKERLRKQRIKNELLTEEVSKKTEEIDELITETAQHIKRKENLTQKLHEFSKGKEGVTMQTILTDLRSTKSDDAKMLLLKENIDKVTNATLKALQKEYHKLTDTDLEICALIRIGLSRKEIASLRNTSLEAVKKARSRLKKKLRLSSEQSLDTFIQKYEA